MSEMLKVVVSLCFFLLWDNRAIHFAKCDHDADAFAIRHESSGSCLTANGSAEVDLGPCAPLQVWKWGSGHRLFHVPTAQCLGLSVRSKDLGLFPCSSEGQEGVLRWGCLEGALHTAYQMGLTVKKGKVVAKPDASDVWTAGEGSEAVCTRAYRVVHTIGGNSAGDPCEFPFLANGSWHHGCLPEADAPGTYWCSTTSDYDVDHKSGRCLLPAPPTEQGCGTLFTDAGAGLCYQFVPSVAVSWQQALDSCRSQGADLLSLAGPEELSSPTFTAGLSGMPQKMWMGLHQLDTNRGWQWSDGRPITLLRWEEGMPSQSILVESDCGVLTSEQNFQSESCSEHLPYVCRKTTNATSPDAGESLDYKFTVCPEGWVPWSGWCYRLEKDEPQGFTDAQARCQGTEAGGGGEGGNLASLHSLDAKEMISTHFHAEGLPLDVWVGLTGTETNNTTVFSWVDQSPVTFTYWGPDQPTQPSQSPSCVFYSGESYGWRVGNCSDRLPFLCQKKGVINESVPHMSCPTEGGWRRHGDSCYQVNPQEVSFKDRCNITIRNGFEQAFLSRLLGEQISHKTRHFWISLQDIKGTGEYQWLGPDGPSNRVTYTNWGWLEPAGLGGCVVMSTAKPLGKWEDKNCTAFKAGTICKKDLVAPPPPPVPNATLPCPEGWVSQPNVAHCYKVFHEERLSRKRSWEEAQRFCRALGADLPSFTKFDDMIALHNAMRSSISDNRFFWVGLNRRNPMDPSWAWSDGSPVSLNILHHDFQYDDAHNRDCTAFKTMKSSLKLLFEHLFNNMDPWPFYATPFHCDAQLEWVCQIPRGATPKVPDWYNPSGHHETSIFVDGGEYWFINDLPLSYEEASLFCSMNGSKLAAPLSFTAAMKIYLHLTQMSTSPKQSWWVDIKQPGRYFPMTISQMHYYHSVFLGRCTSLSAENLFPEYDYSCEHKLPFVCERHNVTSVERNPLEPNPDGFSCENGSLAFRDKCFTILKESKHLMFKSANEVCKSLRGTLVTIADQVEQDFITTLLPQMADLQKIWIGLKLRSTYREWVDDTPVAFQNFNPLLHGMLRPMRITTMNADSMELCVFMINQPSSELMGTWDYSTCGEEQHTALCQHYADKPSEPEVPSEPLQVNNHTVQLLRGNMTWLQAALNCRGRDMDLASVADAYLQASLTVLVSRARTPMWIGLFSEDDGAHYRWTDHSHTVFSRWSPDASSGSCVYQDTDGFWKATECEEVLGGAICHKPHEETVIKPEDTAVKCPHTIKGPNWLPFRNNCYSFQLVASRWDQYNKGHIQETCKSLYANANILTIRNAEENEFVRQQLVPFKDLVQFVWLGLFKDNNDNQMKWYEGTNVQFSNWRNGRPDVDGEFMAGLNKDGVWELITNKNYFSPFKQRSIVACKLDNEPKEKYNQTAQSLQDYGSLTFQVVARRLTWHQAVEECAQRGAHLASIHDDQHHVHAELIARTDGFPLWLGLSNQDRSNPAYEWSDGTSYDYRPTILNSQKGAAKSQAGCVYISPSGGWVMEDCNTVAEGALCYNTSTTTSTQRAKLQSPAVTNNCPLTGATSHWVEFNDHCYAFDMTLYNSTVYNMHDALGICVNMGGRLLTVTSVEENNFVASQVSADPLITHRVWLGMDMNQQGQPVSWVDDSPMGFSNWANSRTPPGVGGDHPCAVLDTADRGRWRRVSCSGSHSRVVCKTTPRSKGSPVALVLLLVILLALTGVIVFLVYKKKKAYFTSTVRYKRNFDEADSTSIITEAE